MADQLPSGQAPAAAAPSVAPPGDKKKDAEKNTATLSKISNAIKGGSFKWQLFAVFFILEINNICQQNLFANIFVSSFEARCKNVLSFWKEVLLTSIGNILNSIVNIRFAYRWLKPHSNCKKYTLVFLTFLNQSLMTSKFIVNCHHSGMLLKWSSLLLSIIYYSIPMIIDSY